MVAGSRDRNHLRIGDRVARPVTDEAPATKETSSSAAGRGLLAAVYVTAAVIGWLLGRQLLGGDGDAKSSSLARVGFALQDDAPTQTQAADWAALRADVDYVRAKLNAETNGVFDLVVAVRGLDHGGTPDWDKAETLCRGLGWSPCDRAALEQLRISSRP